MDATSKGAEQDDAAVERREHSESGHRSALPTAQAPPSELDFTSESFDALKALTTPNLQPPVPDAQLLDNIAKFRTHLPPEHLDALVNVEVKRSTEESRAKGQALKERALRTLERIHASTARLSLETVMSYVKPGPASVLGQWMASGNRVRVVTRHAAGVRGVAIGTLVAYDRFMNLVLREVDEEYTVMTRVPRAKARQVLVDQQPCVPASQTHALGERPGGNPSSDSSVGGLANAAVAQAGQGPASAVKESVKWCRKQERRTRQLGQVFVKADNIVTISCVPTPHTAADAGADCTEAEACGE